MSFDLSVQAQLKASAVLEDVLPGTSDVEIVLLPCAAVTGIVVDEASGAPVPRFEVLAFSGRGELREHLPPEGFLRVSDPQGRFDLDALEPGETTIVVRAEGYCDDTRVVPLRPASRADLAVMLRRGRTLTGTVVGGDGQPIEAARIFVGEAPAQADRRLARGRSDGQGRFTITGVPDAPVRISATHPRVGVGSTLLDAGEVGFVRILLMGVGGLSGSVTCGDSYVRSGFITCSPSDAPSRMVRLGPNGTYSIGDCPAGPAMLSVRLWADDGLVREAHRHVEVRPGASVTVDFALRPGSSKFEGLVLLEHVPAAAANIGVSIQYDGLEEVRSTATTLQGWFELTGLPAGAASVAVGAGDRTQRASFELVAGAQVRRNFDLGGSR